MRTISAIENLAQTELPAKGLRRGSTDHFRGLPVRTLRDIGVAVNGSVALARYIVRATGAAGPVEFQQRLTIEAALAKARELRDAHFSHITIFNVLTGVEITDVELLLTSQGNEGEGGS